MVIYGSAELGLTKIQIPFIFGILQVHRQTLLELLHRT